MSHLPKEEQEIGEIHVLIDEVAVVDMVADLEVELHIQADQAMEVSIIKINLSNYLVI